MGAGGSGSDAVTLHRQAWSPQERRERFAEFIELTDRLLRDPVTTYEGRYYSAFEARNHPGCVQQPRVPFAIAAAGPRALRLAAMHADTWVTVGPLSGGPQLSVEASVPVLKDQVRRFEEACVEVGRDPRDVGRLAALGGPIRAPLGSVEEFRDTAGRYAEVGMTDLVVHWPRDTEPFAGNVEVLEQIAAEVLPESS